MKKLIYILCAFAALSLPQESWAESIKTAVYEYEQAGTGHKQIYLLSLKKEAVQLFLCGTKGNFSLPSLAASLNLDVLAQEHCSPLLSNSSPSRMTKGVRNGQLVSLHLAGTETPEARALAMLGDAKSWLAVFTVNENESESLLFTGVGIEVGAGLPRTDSVRVTLKKIAEGELSASYPMLPLQSL